MFLLPALVGYYEASTKCLRPDHRFSDPQTLYIGENN